MRRGINLQRVASDEQRNPRQLRSRKVEFFRGQKTRTGLPSEEKRLLALLSVHLCFLPWSMAPGVINLGSQTISLVLSIVGLGLALASRQPELDETSRNTAAAKVAMWPKLLRFPIFWIGLALLAYVAVQGFNPSWNYLRNEKGTWWVVKVPHVSWLPTSVTAPFNYSNAWRELMIYGAAWLSICSVWVGFTRRSSIRILLGVITANAVGLGAWLVYQRITGGTQLPWPLAAVYSRANLTASFVYSNHAGAYFALLTFPAIMLAIWSHDQGARALKKSTPASLLALAAFFLAGSVLFTFSRGGSLALGVAILFFSGWFFIRSRHRAAAATGDFRLTLALVALFGSFAVYVGRSLDSSRVQKQFGRLLEQRFDEPSVSSRLQVSSAGMRFFAEFSG